jgi:hypothetical protein
MKKYFHVITILLAGVVFGPVAGAHAAADKVKVFLLAGQSNMEGHGQTHSLPWLGEHGEGAKLLEMLKDADGSWAIRDDVTIAWRVKKSKSGPLTVGWGRGDKEVGPELMFGTIMGEKYEAPVLLIKTAWGGKDVFCDFRSPSAGDPVGDAAKLLEKARADGREREIGHYYREMLREVRTTLASLEEVVPGYEGQGYELAGMAWFQGWNDYCQWRNAPGIIDTYSQDLAAMFRDLRQDLEAPAMPIVIGEMGIGGRAIEERAKNKGDREAHHIMAFRRAQQAVALDESIENVTFVPTAEFWDDRLEDLRRQSDAYRNERRSKGLPDNDENRLPTKELSDEFRSRGGHWYCHYNGSAANYSLVGYALAEALNR